MWPRRRNSGWSLRVPQSTQATSSPGRWVASVMIKPLCLVKPYPDQVSDPVGANPKNRASAARLLLSGLGVRVLLADLLGLRVRRARSAGVRPARAVGHVHAVL